MLIIIPERCIAELTARGINEYIMRTFKGDSLFLANLVLVQFINGTSYIWKSRYCDSGYTSKEETETVIKRVMEKMIVV